MTAEREALTDNRINLLASSHTRTVESPTRYVLEAVPFARGIEREVRAALADAPAAVPMAGQCRFPGVAWGACDVEHVAMVLADPKEWPGYEVRYLYAAPTPAATPPQDTAPARVEEADQTEVRGRVVIAMDEKHEIALLDLCREQDMTPDQVMRHALRLYQREQKAWAVEQAAIEAAQPTVQAGAEYWRHKKTGGIYEWLMSVVLEADKSVHVVYRSVETGVRWCRPSVDFYDGRFERVATPPAQQPVQAATQAGAEGL